VDTGRNCGWTECRGVPYFAAKEFEGNDPLSVLKQADEEVERALADLDWMAISAQCEEFEIEFEFRELDLAHLVAPPSIGV
jgi:hypothetical protein